MNPVFSIIIPTRNREQLLKECLESVLQQVYADFECLIIDDGSSDGTRDSVKLIKDERFQYHHYPVSDRSLVRNKGIDLAKGQYICFVDDDDLITPDYLEAFFEVINSKHYRAEIIRTSFIMLLGHKTVRSVHYNKDRHGHPLQFIAYNMCGVGSLCIPKEYLTEFRFPEKFPHWQDTYLFLLLLSKYQLIQIPRYTYLYRIHESMGSKLVVDQEQLSIRAKKNVAAIQDFKSNFMSLVRPYLSEADFDFLVAEKYIQYADQAKTNGFFDLAKSLKECSLKIDWYLRLWKYYLRLLSV